ncbi:MAG: transcriptional repressor LexA [Clostridia bacterium]|nr:transcriptional repressor LexA [Clostridia bacterium]
MAFDKKVFGTRLRSLMHENHDTVYSVAEYLGMKPSTVSRYTNGLYVPKAPTLDALARRYGVNAGWLMGEREMQQCIEDKTEPRLVPILGVVAAGIPIWAEENLEGYTAVDADDHVDFVLRVKGDSMINARIYDGDLVYVRKQPDVENGEIAVVMVDNEATVKRIYKYANMIVLRPENSAFSEMIFKKADAKTISILGKVLYVKGRVK